MSGRKEDSSKYRNMDTLLLPERIRKMLSPRGFQEIFWKELQMGRKEDSKVRRREVFDNLNLEFHKYTGYWRYTDYESFAAAMRRK